MKTFCLCLYRRHLLLLILVSYITPIIYAQAPPKFEPPKSITTTTSPQAQPVYPMRSRSILPNDPYREQNLRILQQSGIMSMPGQPTHLQMPKELKREERNEQLRSENFQKSKWFSAYQNNFLQFLQLNPDSFSITRAVYLSESAWYDRPYKYQEFEASIKQGAELVRQILKREGLSETNNTAVNYAIQKLYTQSNIYYDSSTKKSFTVEKLRYDFNDFWGDKDWSKTFVTKLLQYGSGQCSSLPEFYLCVAQELSAKAYLSISPNHSYIQYFDEKGRRYNFETTNGNLVTQNFHMQSGYINATALKNKTYLDTMSSRQLYAHLLGYLLLGYSTKTSEYDNLAQQITRKIISIDSSNMIALMTLANVYGSKFRELWKVANYPFERDFNKYPELNEEYQLVKTYEQKIEQLGVQGISAQAYQKWLKSIEHERQKEHIREEAERMQKEIERLKKLKHTFINKPKQ